MGATNERRAAYQLRQFWPPQDVPIALDVGIAPSGRPIMTTDSSPKCSGQVSARWCAKIMIMIMQGTIWGWISAAIGLAVLVLLFFYGIDYGTWVDEAGPLRSSPPAFILPFAVGGLGVVLSIGGFCVGVAGTVQRTLPRR